MKHRRIRLALFFGCVAVMAAHLAWKLKVGTDITNFLPKESRAELAALISSLADSEMTRTMVLTVGSANADAARAGARELAEALRAQPGVAWVRTGLDPNQLEQLYRLYFPQRYHFLSDQPEREIPALVGDEALRARARRVKQALALPSSTVFERLAAEDPLGGFERIVERFRGGEPELRLEQGQFLSSDGRWAIVLVGMQSSAFDSGVQAPLLDTIDRSFAEINARSPVPLELEQSGANRFAVAAERSMRRDVVRISAVSFVGVAVLFLAFFRSLHGFLLAAFPSLFGILTATSSTLLLFGHVDGITLAFGASLIGVCIDFSIHVMNHNALDGDGAPPEETTRRLGGALTVAALTSIASFAGFTLTSFPGFRQIGVFAMVGVTAALMATLWVLPLFLRGGLPVPALSARVASALGRSVEALVPHRRALALVPILSILLALVVLPRLQWLEDLSGLMSFEPGMRAEDQRVRERISRVDDGRLVVAVAPDEESAVAKNDRVYERLEAARAAGQLDGSRSLHTFLWSKDLQERNWETLHAQPELTARVKSAFVAEGFRADALERFRSDFEAGPPPPLRAQDLRASSLSDLLSPLLLHLGERVAAVTWLRGVHAPEELSADLAGIPDVHLIDRHAVLNSLYTEFRITTLEQTGVGCLLVLAVVAFRYRRVRPALAAFLPSMLAGLLVFVIFALLGIEANLLHVISLELVLGMGVDYGIFIVDSAHQGKSFDATLLSILLCSLTTIFVFGTLTLSRHPALQAIGATTSLGVLLSFLFAPLSLVVMGGLPSGVDGSAAPPDANDA